MIDLHNPRQMGLAGLFVLFQLYIVWKVWASRAKLSEMKVLPARSRHYTSTLIGEAFLVFISLAVAYALGLRLFPRVVPTPADLMMGLIACVALVLFMIPRWKAAVKKGSRRLYFLMPEGPKEKALWVAVSAAAGFCEEITYRGVLYWVLIALTGQWWLAALVSALIFAGAHANQSWLSMAIIFGFALVFQALAIRTGSLYVSMLVHFLYDVVAGFTYAKLGREMGYRAEGDPGAGAAAAAPATD